MRNKAQTHRIFQRNAANDNLESWQKSSTIHPSHWTRSSICKLSQLLFFSIIFASQIFAQEFQRAYGTALDNSFTKVVQDAAGNFYVLGQDEAVNGALQRATVTRLDANGLHQWTLSLNFASLWHDAVLTPSGELMLVGQTLPSDPTAKGIMARVTSAGSFARLRTYDEQGRDIFTRIVRQTGTFPYYVIGAQFEPGGTPTTEDVVLFNLDQDLNINWKKKYFIAGDDEFFRDFESLNSSELLMAGNMANGVIFKTDNNGNMLGGVQIPDRFYRDVAKELFGGFYAAATNFSNSEAYVQKFDATMLLQWEAKIQGLSTISQVWEGLPGSGEVYATGAGVFGGQQRTVVVKLLDIGSGPSVVWVKYLHTGTGFIGGTSWFLPSVQIAFTDARTIPSGFGQSCAFISVSDTEMETCEVTTTTTDLLFTDPIPESPLLFFPEMQPPTNGVNSTEASALNWQQQEVCSNAPCEVSLTLTALNNCGLVQVCANATGPGPFTYQWCDGQTSQCVTTQLPCGTHDFCVTVFCSDGTSSTATLTHVVSDIVPPVALCAGVGVDLDANCSATITPALIDGGSSDNCLIQSMSVSPSVVTGCGLHPVTLTVTDWCGNTSTCQTSVQTIEVTLPVIMCPPSATKACNTNTGPAFCGTATATDNCDANPTISFSDVTSGILPCDGTIQRTWKAEDDCGNVSTCVQNITVIDNVPPTLTNCPQNVTVTGSFNAVGLCVADVQVASPTATDNCDQNVTLVNSFNNTSNASGTYPQGTTTVTWTATDDCGRTATCVHTVTVECEDPFDFPGLHCGQAVVTCFSGFNSPTSFWSGVNQNAPVVALVDIRDHSTGTPGTWWQQPSATEYSHPTWTPQNLGQVFGIAIDQNDDIFVAASSIYTCNTTTPITYNPFTAAGPGAIYRIDGTTGLTSNIISTGPFSSGGTTIPNNGSALGDIGYDALNDQFFVTNHADGMIYRVKGGQVLSRFDPFGSANLPASGQGSDPSFVELAERTWGVAYFNNRVYFGTWKEDTGRPNGAAANEIWSIGLTGAGEFAATNLGGGNFENGEVMEISIPVLPGGNYSNPVSDIAFSKTGKMLLAERTMATDCGGAFSTNWFGYAHNSRQIEYEFNAGLGQWVLTPGHIPSISTSNTNLKFRIGNNGGGSNSAGGCDYGYDSFDPAVVAQPDCDRFSWCTGDNLYPGGPPPPLACPSTVTVTWLYGLQGTPSTGGANINSLLIDLDNNVCSHDKILLGDVEILKCGCINTDPDFPCDSLWVTKDSISFQPGELGDTCCWDIDFHVNAGPVAYLEVESITPGVTFNNTALSSNFQWGGTPTGTLLPIVSSTPGHGMPQGNYNSALTFCLGNILTPAQDTQCVVFRWYVFGPTDVPYLACTDTCYFFCPPPIFGDTCLAIKNDSVACNPDNPLEYCYFFSAQNLANFNASQVVLSNPTTGFSFKPCPPPNIPFTSTTIALPNPALNPGVAPDSCFPQMCVKIVATTPIISPTQFCFEAGLSSNDSCCHSAVEHCITLEPCCDPCEDRAVVVHTVPPVDSCCHSLDITNDCKLQFFTKLELELLTPGVIFGSHYTGGPSPSDWTNPISTNNLIQWQHISGFVPNGTTAGLINFCLDEIDMPSEVPQIVVLNWITTNAAGEDSVACSDTLIFDCPPVLDNKCVEVLEQSIECVEDANGNVYYQLTMTIQNVSTPPHTANELIFTQLSGPPVTLFPNPVLFAPLPPNGIVTITTFIFGSGLNVGDKLTFEVRLHDSFSGDNWCCFEGDSVCVFIPPCGPQCFCAPSDLVITQGSVSQTLFCTQGAPTPVLPCPPDDVTISGFFGCTSNPPPCPSTAVNWTLTGPLGFIASGATTGNNISLTFPQSQVSANGSYFLTLSTLCPGAVDSCICTVRWIRECPTDTCCTNFDEFCALVAQGFTVVADPALCKVTVTAPQFDTCHWFSTPPFIPGTNVIQVITDPDGMWMFNFNQGGTYQICVNVFEQTGDSICWQKEMCTTFDLDCGGGGCECGHFADMNWRPTQGAPNQAITCGQELTLGCLPPGYNVQFGGNFSCVGNCPPSVVNWVLREKISQNTVASGTTNGPGFQISVPGNSFVFPTVYELVFTGICNGMVCEECIFTIVTTECPCHCGAFDKMFMRSAQGAPSIAMHCGEAPVQVNCPPPGQSLSFTGLFQCDGPDCLATAAMDWKLIRLPNTTVATGSTTSNPFFGINILPNWYATPGTYELQLSGYCGLDTCTCDVQFTVDCPNPCPCTSADIQALQAAVNQGFSVVKYPTSCKACFAPVALSDCEEVVWHLNTANGPVIGNSVGNNSICHTFPGAGTYTVVMVVTRKKPDGSTCEVFVKSRTVTITCLVLAECTDSDFPNSTFAEGAIGGGMLSGGASAGWTAVSGEPVIIEGMLGSLDAWTVLVSGNFDTSAVVGTIDSACVEKSLVTLTMRAKPIGPTGQFRSMACDKSGWTANVPASGRYAFVPLSVFDSSEWVEVEISMDISGVPGLTPCNLMENGIWIQPKLTVTNAIGNNQGGEETYSYLQLDNVCINGMPLTAVRNPTGGQSIRLFPNPTSGGLTLEFAGEVPSAGAVQILDLYGRVMHTERLLPSQQSHQLSISSLTAGMYFVRVTEGGNPVWTQRVVKQ